MNHFIKIVEQYDFPVKLFDFKANNELYFVTYRDLEKYINKKLLSKYIEILKNGLSNVLYWGYNRIGYGSVRVERFRDKITQAQLALFRELIKIRLIVVLR